MLAIAFAALTLHRESVTLNVTVPKALKAGQAVISFRVESPANAIVAFRVFVDMPRANLKTPLEGRNYLGYLVLPARDVTGELRVQTPFLGWPFAKSLSVRKVTLVPLPENSMPVTIGRVSIQ